MSFKQQLPGIVVGAIVGALAGMGGTYYVLNGRMQQTDTVLAPPGDVATEPIERSLAQPVEAATPPAPKESPPQGQPSWPRSPDGKYEAIKVAFEKGAENYRVMELATGRIAITTQPERKWPNDVKAGLFGPDSKRIAAAYHYGENGGYTWVGIWDIETGTLVETKKQSGWVRNLHWVFEKGNE